MNEKRSASTKLNILNVIVTVPDTRHGGAERAGLSFGDALTDYAEVDTVMMGGLDSDLVSELELTELIHPIPAHTLLRDLAKKIIPSSNNIWNAAISTRLTPPKPVQTYDLIQIHNAVPIMGMACAALQSRLAGVPYCVTTHGISKIPEIPDELCLTNTQRFVFNQTFLRLYRWILGNAAHLFALSNMDKDRIKEWFPEQSVSVLRNGVKLNNSERRQDESEVIAQDIPTLLFVGRLMQSKGIEDLLDAYELLDIDCQLLVVGPVRNESYLQRIKSMDQRVQYVGYVNQNTLDNLYREADLFVFPTRSDVFPLVTLEAMAAGTPIVSTTVGGLPEQIPDSAGLLVSPNAPEEVAEAIESILVTDSFRKEMGLKGRKVVQEQYSWSAIASEAVQTYVEILNDGKTQYKISD